MPAQKKLFTISEAAKFLGVSTDTLRRWEKNSKIKTQRTLGNARRYRIEDLQELKNNPNTVKAADNDLLNQTYEEVKQIKAKLETQEKSSFNKNAKQIYQVNSNLQKILFALIFQFQELKNAISNNIPLKNLKLNPNQGIGIGYYQNPEEKKQDQEKRKIFSLLNIATFIIALLLFGSITFLIIYIIPFKQDLSNLNNQLKQNEIFLQEIEKNKESQIGNEQEDAISNNTNFKVDDKGNIYFTGGLTGGYIDTDTENLIINSSFEQNDNGQPDFYTLGGNATEGNTYLSQDTSFAGNNALKIEPKMQENYIVSPTYKELKAGKNYTFTAYIKSLQLGKSTISIGYGDEKQSYEINGTSTWRMLKFNKSFAENENPDSSKFFINLKSENGGGALYLDSLQIETGTIATGFKEKALRSDGTINVSQNQIYPVIGNSGSLGTENKPFNELYVSNQNINGNLNVKGNTDLEGNVEIDGILDIDYLKAQLANINNLNSILITATKIGIGTSNPQTALDVSGDIKANNLITSQNITSSGKVSTNTLQISTGANNGYLLVSDANGNTAWKNPNDLGVNNSEYFDSLNSSQFLRSDTSDTFDAGNTLTVNGNLDINSNLYISDSDISLDGSTTNFSSNGDISFNTDQLFIDKTSGFVGIGTNTPKYFFDVNGEANINGQLHITTLTDGFLTIDTGDLSTSGTLSTQNLQIIKGAGAGYILTSDATGNASWQNLATSAGAWTVTDYNLYPDDSNYNIALGTNDTFGYKLYVQGDSFLNGDLTAQNTVIDGTLAVNDITTLNNNLNVNGITMLNSSLTVGSTTTLNATATLNSTLYVAGVTTLNNSLTVAGLTTINNDLHTTGSTDIDTNLNVD
ncbi:MerR family DNA-binding transcriptional regulator, partial [Candidatus Beckwithbacteria bacterium]|nr:MerR family DNA-binding transcriptional regulator [Candidatus Beckwithbacteria bacterium]